MFSKKKYSVIIPVYNSEKTIKRCLFSLIKQANEEVELIIINDGSTDSSEYIIKECIQKFGKRNAIDIIYLKQDNSGVSRARNLGLERARGEYILFVDSDDYVSENYFGILNNVIDSDLLVFAYGSRGKNIKNELNIYKKLKKNYSCVSKLEILLKSRSIMPPWNKRFKRKLINQNHLKFDETLSIGEDFDFCLKYAVTCKSIEVINQRLYYNDTINLNSLSRGYRNKLDRTMSRVFKKAEKTVINSQLSVKEKRTLFKHLDYLYIKNLFSCIAEDFKLYEPCYLRERSHIVRICRYFEYHIGKTSQYVNIIHLGLRILLKLKTYFMFYIVTYLIKGKAFQAYIIER